MAIPTVSHLSPKLSYYGVKLRRVRIDGIKDKRLKPGEWRKFTLRVEVLVPEASSPAVR